MQPVVSPAFSNELPDNLCTLTLSDKLELIELFLEANRDSGKGN